jgi:hypothetical protein
MERAQLNPCPTHPRSITRSHAVDFGIARTGVASSYTQMILHRPGADHVQGRSSDGASGRTALGLSVDGDRPQFRPARGHGRQAVPGHERGHPVGETPLESHRVQEAEDAAERVVRGDTSREAEEGAQPVELRFGVIGDLLPAIGPAQDAADGHEDDLVESVDLPMFASRIGEECEMLEDRGRVHGQGCCVAVGCHGDRP